MVCDSRPSSGTDRCKRSKLQISPRAGASSALGRTVAAETALVVLILAATAALGTTPRPRALAGGAEGHAGHTEDTGKDSGRTPPTYLPLLNRGDSLDRLVGD